MRPMGALASRYVCCVSCIISWLRLDAPFCATLIALGPVAVFQRRTTVAYWRLPAMVTACSFLISVFLKLLLSLLVVLALVALGVLEIRRKMDDSKASRGAA